PAKFGCVVCLIVERHGYGRQGQAISTANSARNRPCDFHARDCPVENNALTDSRESATIVKSPRIVPKGMKKHSTQATTSTEEKALRRERHPPAMRIQMAIVTPTRKKNAPSKIKIQPRNVGGSSWLPGPG